ncbi:hypothetical protein MKEN_01311400 [Mycena kentingensis (nom. inval.)]|nr:hypothetical protein MKEN_01311400 [Mycena kentingensis (nom. inval.)]
MTSQASPSRPPPSVHSVRSWWSDSNSVGATVDIHAIAKPLLGYMYHREVRKLLRLRENSQLSIQELQHLRSYLLYQHTRLETKALILEDLRDRVWRSPDRQLHVADVFSSSVFMQILEAPASPPIFRAACGIVAHLAADPDVRTRFPDYTRWCPYDEIVGSLRMITSGRVVASMQALRQFGSLTHPDYPDDMRVMTGLLDGRIRQIMKPKQSQFLATIFGQALADEPLAIILLERSTILQSNLKWAVNESNISEFVVNELERVVKMFDSLGELGGTIVELVVNIINGQSSAETRHRAAKALSLLFLMQETVRRLTPVIRQLFNQLDSFPVDLPRLQNSLTERVLTQQPFMEMMMGSLITKPEWASATLELIQWRFSNSPPSPRDAMGALIMQYLLWRLMYESRTSLRIAGILATRDWIFTVIDDPPHSEAFTRACKILALLAAQSDVVEKFSRYGRWCPYNEFRHVPADNDEGPRLVAGIQAWVRDHRAPREYEPSGDPLRRLSGAFIEQIAPLGVTTQHGSEFLYRILSDAVREEPFAVVLIEHLRIHTQFTPHWHNWEGTLVAFIRRELDASVHASEFLDVVMQEVVFTLAAAIVKDHEASAENIRGLLYMLMFRHFVFRGIAVDVGVHALQVPARILRDMHDPVTDFARLRRTLIDVLSERTFLDTLMRHSYTWSGADRHTAAAARDTILALAKHGFAAEKIIDCVRASTGDSNARLGWVNKVFNALGRPLFQVEDCELSRSDTDYGQVKV